MRCPWSFYDKFLRIQITINRTLDIGDFIYIDFKIQFSSVQQRFCILYTVYRIKADYKNCNFNKSNNYINDLGQR